MKKSAFVACLPLLLLSACAADPITRFTGADLLKWTAEAPTTECKELKRRIKATEMVDNDNAQFLSKSAAQDVFDGGSFDDFVAKSRSQKQVFKALAQAARAKMVQERDSRCSRGLLG